MKGNHDCLDTMVQNIILPQNSLAQNKKNVKKGCHDCLEIKKGGHDCLDPMVHNIILPQNSSAQNMKNIKKGCHDGLIIDKLLDKKHLQPLVLYCFS